VTAVPVYMISLAQAAAVDTVYVTPAAGAGWRLWVDTLSGVAQIVIALALLLLGGVLIASALAGRRAYLKALRQMEKLRVDLDPLLKGANTVGENVARISATAREEAEKVQRALARAQSRAEAAAEAAEQRVGEFNALLDVVQEEAEELFIGTAATLRGARAGASAFKRADDPAVLDEPTDDELSDEELEQHISRREQSRRRSR
jgi:hypothetical protein